MKKTTLTLATGAAFAATVALVPAANAADNPFGMVKLDSGYQLAQADKKADGKCGEGKCGGTMKAEDKRPAGDKKKEGSCGGSKEASGGKGDKKQDGACGGKK
jgi:uncharacterized low-complexity protein